MSCPNFKSMRDFPLIVADDPYLKPCPDCGAWNSEEATKCEDCGCSLEDVSPVYDELSCEDICNGMQRVADRMNGAQPFYNVTVESGHYRGVQFYVDCKYYERDLLEMDSEDSRDEFGWPRWLMLRKFKSAGNMIRRELEKARKEMGLDKLVCIDIFSNGEAIYRKVS